MTKGSSFLRIVLICVCGEPVQDSIPARPHVVARPIKRIHGLEPESANGILKSGDMKDHWGWRQTLSWKVGLRRAQAGRAYKCPWWADEQVFALANSSTDTQAAPGRSKANALPSTKTAGRWSQSKNLMVCLHPVAAITALTALSKSSSVGGGRFGQRLQAGHMVLDSA